MVLRYSIPDSSNGAGIDADLSLYVNGVESQNLALTSKYAWVYGSFPYTNVPSQESAHRFFDESRVFFNNGSGICLGTNYDTYVNYSGTTVNNNPLVRCGSMHCDYNYPIGALWIWSTINPMSAEYIINGNTLNDCSYEGILFDVWNTSKTFTISDTNINGATYGIYICGNKEGAATKEEMYVGSKSDYVKSYAATSDGISSISYGSATATSYIMTMTYDIEKCSANALSANYYMRAYAKLSNNTYVYSEVITYSIYNVADILYQNQMLNTIEQHNYLYNKILSVVKPDYKVVDFYWGNTLVTP